MIERRRVTRFVLGAGILAGFLQALTLPRFQPEQVALATDVYAQAAATLLEGGNPYAVSPPSLPGYSFLYQPVVLLVLLPYGLIGPTGAYLVQTGLNLVSTGLLGVLLLWTIEQRDLRLATIDRVLVVGFAFMSVGTVTNFVNGQVNPQLALGIAVGAVLLERNRERGAGVAFALIATIKLFPALLGAWLVRLRAWRAIAAAVGTGVGLFVLGAAVLGPDLAVTYVTEAVPREASAVQFAGGPDAAAPQMTIRRQIGFLAPSLSSGLVLAVALLILAPVIVASSWRVETVTQRLVALQATWVAVLVLFPLEPFYLSLTLFPMVPLLYLLEERSGWVPFVAGAFVISVPVTLSTATIWIENLPFSATTSTVLMDLLEQAFGFALPPMYGVWLLFAGCVSFQLTGR